MILPNLNDFPLARRLHSFSQVGYLMFVGAFGRCVVMRPLLVMLVLLLFPSLSSAASTYVAQNAAGGNTGADCTNAHAATFFNTAANWGAGAGQIGAGTTVHLCGVITTELTAHGSGTNGSPI